jgi:hypothetical protein
MVSKKISYPEPTFNITTFESQVINVSMFYFSKYLLIMKYADWLTYRVIISDEIDFINVLLL